MPLTGDTAGTARPRESSVRLVRARQASSDLRPGAGSLLPRPRLRVFAGLQHVRPRIKHPLLPALIPTRPLCGSPFIETLLEVGHRPALLPRVDVDATPAPEPRQDMRGGGGSRLEPVPLLSRRVAHREKNWDFSPGDSRNSGKLEPGIFGPTPAAQPLRRACARDATTFPAPSTAGRSRGQSLVPRPFLDVAL